MRLRDGGVCGTTFDLVSCDGGARLILGTEHWPAQSSAQDEKGRLWKRRRQACAQTQEEDDARGFRFVLIKRQSDTLEAIAELALALHVPQRTFSFAGIKDSWAVTAQEVCAHFAPGLTPMEVAAAVHEHLPSMRVEQFHTIPEREGRMGWLAPGRLRGNRFSIVIRSACPGLEGAAAAEAQIRAAVEQVKTSGFINYVGPQRFAKGRVRSDLVGLAYLKGDYPLCVDAMLVGAELLGADHDVAAAHGSQRAVGRSRAHAGAGPASIRCHRVSCLFPCVCAGPVDIHVDVCARAVSVGAHECVCARVKWSEDHVCVCVCVYLCVRVWVGGFSGLWFRCVRVSRWPVLATLARPLYDRASDRLCGGARERGGAGRYVCS